MKRLLAFLLALVATFSGGVATAYDVLTTSSGSEVRWYLPVVYYYIDPDGFEDFEIDELIRVTNQCFETWMSVHAGPEFVYAGTIDIKTPSDDCFNVIFFVQDPIDWMEMFHQEDGTAMAMTRTYVDPGGRVMGFDLGFNDAGYDFTNTDDMDAVVTDYANTLTHEIGHVLGLDHSEDPDAVMYPTAPEGEISKRTLSEDDRAGLRYLYREPMPEVRYGCGANPDPHCPDAGMSCDQGVRDSEPSRGTSSFLLWALPVVLMRLRRTRCGESRGWRKPCDVGPGLLR